MQKFNKRSQRLKDKKISILSDKPQYDDSGFPIEGKNPIPGGENIWAYYRQASGEEFYAAAKVNTRVDAIFVINWRDDIDETMLIEFRGEEYDIYRIDDFEGYKNDITIYAYIKK